MNRQHALGIGYGALRKFKFFALVSQKEKASATSLRKPLSEIINATNDAVKGRGKKEINKH